jgi:hypothetical protein
VLLKLRGTDTKGKPVEISSITENLSESGFFCNCIVPLVRRADVEVFLSGSKERYAGIAKIMGQKSPNPLAAIWLSVPREPVSWILEPV